MRGERLKLRSVVQVVGTVMVDHVLTVPWVIAADSVWRCEQGSCVFVLFAQPRLDVCDR